GRQSAETSRHQHGGVYEGEQRNGVKHAAQRHPHVFLKIFEKLRSAKFFQAALRTPFFFCRNTIISPAEYVKRLTKNFVFIRLKGADRGRDRSARRKEFALRDGSSLKAP